MHMQKNKNLVISYPQYIFLGEIKHKNDNRALPTASNQWPASEVGGCIIHGCNLLTARGGFKWVNSTTVCRRITVHRKWSGTFCPSFTFPTASSLYISFF